MVDSILIIIAFIAGVFAGVYCLRLGMMWTTKEQPAPVKLPLTPFNKPPQTEEEPTEDKTLEHWFVGGENR